MPVIFAVRLDTASKIFDIYIIENANTTSGMSRHICIVRLTVYCTDRKPALTAED
jgi:hypothetical protein